MSNIQPYIILNGTDSRSITGLLISALAPISKPLQRTLVDTVDGRDGDLVTPLGFSAYDKTISIALTYGYDIDDIIEYFNSDGVVTFSNEPDKYYRYAIYEQIDFERLIRFKTAEVTLHCQPFKFSTTETPKLFNVTSGSPITVKNDGNYQSRPNLTIIGSGDVDLSLNGSQILSIDLGAEEQAVIIDTEDMNAYAAQSAIKEVIAEINPIQEGSGDPSPDNIRPIIGHTECNVTLFEINIFNKVYNIPFVDDQGDPLTVYGGSLNVTTGLLEVTRAIVDLGDLSYTRLAILSGYAFVSGIISDMEEVGNVATIDSKCSSYPLYMSGNGSVMIDKSYRLGGTYMGVKRISVRDDNYTTTSDFKTAVQGVQVIYPLATPIEIQLTPTQINNLLGLNQLYTDTNGEIEVTFSSNGVIQTQTGDIVSFDVGAEDMTKGILLNRLITGDYDKIRLKKGENTLTLTGGAQQLVIDKYSRWL